VAGSPAPRPAKASKAPQTLPPGVPLVHPWPNVRQWYALQLPRGGPEQSPARTQGRRGVVTLPTFYAEPLLWLGHLRDASATGAPGNCGGRGLLAGKGVGVEECVGARGRERAGEGAVESLGIRVGECRRVSLGVAAVECREAQRGSWTLSSESSEPTSPQEGHPMSRKTMPECEGPRPSDAPPPPLFPDMEAPRAREAASKEPGASRNRPDSGASEAPGSSGPLDTAGGQQQWACRG